MNKDISEDSYDPADYIFKQVEFCDCCLTVGKPSSGEIEEVPVVKIYLLANSSVFRNMLMNSSLADPSGSNTHITDVRPEIFKLMLRYMYGGNMKVLKSINKEKLLELAFCAEKYNVQYLVEKTCEHMIPANANEVFIPLRFVAYVPNPVLLQSVTKLIQEETDQIIRHQEFLELDEYCMEFITKQEKLAVEEVDLWRSLLKWGKCQGPRRSFSLQEILKKPLAHIRFGTFSVEQISGEVVDEGILSASEALKILRSAATKNVVDITGICKRVEKRNKSETYVNKCDISYPCISWSPTHPNFDILCWDTLSDKSILVVKNVMENSNLEIRSLQFLAKDFNKTLQTSYSLKYDITVLKEDGIDTNSSFTVQRGVRAISNTRIDVPLKSLDGKYCNLCFNEQCVIFIKFNSTHPIYKAVNKTSKKVEIDYGKNDNTIHVKFIGECFHVIKISYVVLSL